MKVDYQNDLESLIFRFHPDPFIQGGVSVAPALAAKCRSQLAEAERTEYAQAHRYVPDNDSSSNRKLN